MFAPHFGVVVGMRTIGALLQKPKEKVKSLYGQVGALVKGAVLQGDPESKSDFRKAAEVMFISLQNLYVYIYIA